MGDVFELTLKKSRRRSNWQMKGKNHEYFPIDFMSNIILHIITQLLKKSIHDKESIYLMKFSDAEFEDCQVILKKSQLKTVGAQQYDLTETKNGLEYFKSNPVFPNLFLRYFTEWPEYLYLKLENTSRMVFLKE